MPPLSTFLPHALQVRYLTATRLPPHPRSAALTPSPTFRRQSMPWGPLSTVDQVRRSVDALFARQAAAGWACPPTDLPASTGRNTASTRPIFAWQARLGLLARLRDGRWLRGCPWRRSSSSRWNHGEVEVDLGLGLAAHPGRDLPPLPAIRFPLMALEIRFRPSSTPSTMCQRPKVSSRSRAGRLGEW
jgi:hypothetical protein